MEEPPFVHVLGAPREFPAVDGQVVPAVELGLHAEFFQGPNHGHGVPGEVEGAALVVGDDEGVVQVAQVVVDRPSSGDPPDHPDSPFLHEGPVHFLCCVLEAAHDNGRFVLPEQEVAGVSPVHSAVKVLLHGQVECRVVALPLDVVHGFLSSRPFLFSSMEAEGGVPGTAPGPGNRQGCRFQAQLSRMTMCAVGPSEHR